MSIIVINKGKVLKGGDIQIEFERIDDTGKTKNCSEKSTIPVHADLTESLAALRVHLAVIGDFVKQKAVKDITNVPEELVTDFTVTGFSVKGGVEMEGVILSGNKKIPRGALNFNTPLVRNSDDAESGYIFNDALILAVEKCQKEFMLYLGGKYAPDPQMELFTEEEK